MFQKGSKTLFNTIFNIPQGLFMTTVVLLFQGKFSPGALATMFVQAYCAGVMLTSVFRMDDFGGWVSQKIHADRNQLSQYFAVSISIGALMGVLMNTLLTFAAVGAQKLYFSAWWHCLGVSIVASVVASCLFSAPVMKLVQKIEERHGV